MIHFQEAVLGPPAAVCESRSIKTSWRRGCSQPRLMLGSDAERVAEPPVCSHVTGSFTPGPRVAQGAVGAAGDPEAGHLSQARRPREADGNAWGLGPAHTTQ